MLVDGCVHLTTVKCGSQNGFETDVGLLLISVTSKVRVRVNEQVV